MNVAKTSLPAGSSTDGLQRKPRVRKGAVARWILVVLMILAAGSAAWYFLWGKTALAQSQAQSGTYTSTTTVERGDLSVTATGTGTLVTSQSVNMSFSTSGKVAVLNVKLGDMVETGDVLASLEKAEDLEANLALAQANLLEVQQALDDLQKKAGLTLASAYQDLVSAQATYDDALAASQLAEYGHCSPEVQKKYAAVLEEATQKLNELYQLDPTSWETTIAQYDHDTALANYNYCASHTATEKTSAQSTLEVAKAALQEAEEVYGKLVDASGVDPDTLAMYETRVETAQTQLDTAQEALDGTTLTATMDGRITYLASGAGTNVDTSTFITISDVSNPVITISLDEADLDKLVIGNRAEVVFTALPSDVFTGTVTLANPLMNSFGPFRAATGQIELDDESLAKFTAANMPLGLSATVTITGEEVSNALLVPAAALKELYSGEYVVNLVGDDGQVTQQTVTVGIQNDTYAEVTSGLEEGDMVSFTMTSSSENSMMSPDGGMFIGGDSGGMPPTR